MIVVWSIAPWWMHSRSFAAAVPAVAADAIEAGATSEDVVNQNENEVSLCVGHVRCGCSLFLALPVALVLTSPTVGMSSTSGLIPLHDIAGLDCRRRVVAR